MTTPDPVDVRELLAEVAELIRNAPCVCHYVDIGVGYQKVAEDPMCPRCIPEGLADAVLSVVEPVIRRQERAEDAEELDAEAAHVRGEEWPVTVGAEYVYGIEHAAAFVENMADRARSNAQEEKP